jgi:hypothetical protein
MDTMLLILALVLLAIAGGSLWIALPGADRVSRAWLRTEAGGLYPLIPTVFFTFGVFTLLKAVGLA